MSFKLKVLLIIKEQDLLFRIKHIKIILVTDQSLIKILILNRNLICNNNNKIMIIHY